jgi:GNAT superfamily N-acetyltransferase
MTKTVTIRNATSEDIPLLLRFLCLLAEFDGHPGSVTAKPEDLERHLFGPVRLCHAVIAEQAGSPVGFATYHFTFSTFSAQPGLWLDDLFVLEEQRGAGVGTAILTRLGSIAVEEGCCRLNWIVNQSNDRGLAFYERIGAAVLHEYRLCCMDEEALATFLVEDGKLRM